MSAVAVVAAGSAVALVVVAAAVGLVLVTQRRRVRGLRSRWVCVDFDPCEVTPVREAAPAAVAGAAVDRGQRGLPSAASGRS